MKLLIDVEKDYYEMLKYNVEHGQDYKPFEIIANGIPVSTEGDLISRKWLTDAIRNRRTYLSYEDAKDVIDLIDNAPTVYDDKAYSDGYTQGTCDCEHAHERPQGEYVNISKLRLMTVEECAGHTIEYAMGWKACIEWIKKGGAA